MDSRAPSRTSARTLLFGTVLVYGLILAGFFRNDWIASALSFSSQGVENVGSTVAPLFAISAFIERAVEIVISATRGPRALALQRQLDRSRDAAREEAQHRFDAYKLHTQRISFTISLGLGLFAGLVGVRALNPLLAPSNHEHRWFNLFDVTLTSLLLAGGSDGIHQVVTTITTFLDSSKSRQKAATPSDDPPAPAAPAPAAPAAPAPAAPPPAAPPPAA